MKGFSLFIPAYNEENVLEKNIRRVDDHLKTFLSNYEIIIIDDTSKDKTPDICKQLSNEHIRYIRYETGPSRRENLGKSIPEARYDWIGFIDIDLATDIGHMKDLIEKLDTYDVVLGSRYKGIRPKREWWRLSISKTYNSIIQILFRSKVNDHNCGFKAFRKEKIEKLMKQMKYDKSFTRGWFWDAELLIRTQKNKFSLIEIPVRWKAGKQSSFNWKRELKMIPYIIKLRIRL
jgi:glycosyltransferase AglD